jgi:uncharacterized protein YaiL (DUF2058 family)
MATKTPKTPSNVGPKSLSDLFDLSGPTTSSRKATSARSKKLANDVNTAGDTVLDSIEVRKLDGSISTLGDVDPTPAAEAAAPAPKGKKGTAVPKSASAAGTAGKSVSPKVQSIIDAGTKRAQALREKAQAELDATKARVAAEKLAAKEKLAAERKAVAEKKKADAAAAKKKREDERAELKAKREQEKAEAEAAKLRGRGFTGNEEEDAIFTEAIEHAKSVAIIPSADTQVSLGFLNIPGVALRGNSLVLPEDLTLAQWTDVLAGINIVKETAQFAIGDALNFGNVKYGEQVAVVSEALGLDPQTVKNFKYVAGLFEPETRVDGLGFTHHLEVAGLYSQNPAAALNILNQALVVGDNGRVKPSSWVRKQVQALRSEGTIAPTPQAAAASRRTQRTAELASISNAQWEADLEDLGNNEAAIARLSQEDTNALVAEAQTNDLVPAAITLRTVARLQAQVDFWKRRAEAAELELASISDAQNRVAGYVAGPTDEELDFAELDNNEVA